MTNSAPPPPENNDPQRRRPVLTFDEMIGVIVAFGALGAIFFWSMGNRIESQDSSRLNDIFSSLNLSQDDLEGEIDTEMSSGEMLSQNEASDTDTEITSSYRDRQPAAIASPNRDRVTLFARPDDESLRLDSQTRLIPTPLSLGNILEPETLEPAQTELPTLDTPSATEPPEATAEAPTPSTTETSEAEPEISFTDVAQDYWAYPFISQLADNELISGTSEDIFEPEKLITRASMASLISMSFDQPETQVMKNFTDVTDENATAADINKAVDMGFMKGYSAKEFRPLENIPRYQVLVAIATGLNLEPPPDVEATLQQFSDSDRVPDWAREQVAAAIEAGLVVNRPEFAPEALNPAESATRAEAAAIIYQALVETGKLEAIESEYIVRPQS